MRTLIIQCLWAAGIALSAKVPLSVQMATSIASRSEGIMTGAGGSSELLQAGIVQKSLNRLVAQYPNGTQTSRLRQYIKESAESVIPFIANATYDALSYPMDRLSNGNALIELHQQTGNASYQVAYENLRNSINLNPRNAEGGLWYYVYPYWSYLDGMYSLAPFYTLYMGRFDKDNSTAISDMLHQLELLWQHCRNETSGLLVHGFDDSRTAVWANSATGASPYVWGRSLGWLAMSLVDTLDTLTDLGVDGWEAGTDAYAKMLNMFQTLAVAILAAVDPKTGGWWQVLDQPGREGNYIESSGTPMFAYSLLKGCRLGFLRGEDCDVHKKVASRAYEYLVNNFVVNNGNGTLGYNGTVSVCSLNSTASYEYYIGRPILFNSVLGSGSFVLASLEYERL